MTGGAVPPTHRKENEMSVHKYGDFTIDTAAIPAKSLEALISRGVTHYLGNEQASKVSGWAKKVLEETKAEPSEDEIKVKKAEFVAAAHAALLDGSIGTRTGGPKLDPLERATRDIAGEEISAMLKKAGQKVPKGKETITVKGQELTFSDLVDRRIASEQHGERIAKDAKARVAKTAKVAEEGLDDL
jgi:hypothetical protein